MLIKLTHKTWLIAGTLILASCGGDSKQNPAGNSAESNGTSGGVLSSSAAAGGTVSGESITSPFKLDLTRPAQKVLAIANPFEARQAMEINARMFMAPSHGQWFAPAGLPHYEECKAQYQQAMQIRAEGDTIVLAGDVDVTACVRVRNQPIESGKVQTFAKIVCKGQDLSRLSSATLADLGEMPCQGATDVHFIAQSLVDIQAKVRVGGVVPVDVTIKEQHSFADGNDAGCHYSGAADALQLSQTCHAIKKISFASPYKLPVIGLPLNKTAYMKASFTDTPFVSDSAKPWYASRAAKVEADGWDGEVVYEGVDSPPRFEMKRGIGKVDGNL